MTHQLRACDHCLLAGDAQEQPSLEDFLPKDREILRLGVLVMTPGDHTAFPAAGSSTAKTVPRHMSGDGEQPQAERGPMGGQRWAHQLRSVRWQGGGWRAPIM